MSYILTYTSFVFLITLFCFFFMPFHILMPFTWLITWHPLILFDSHFLLCFSSLHFVDNFILHFPCSFDYAWWKISVSILQYYLSLNCGCTYWIKPDLLVIWSGYVRCECKNYIKFYASAPDWNRKNRNGNLFWDVFHSLNCISIFSTALPYSSSCY